MRHPTDPENRARSTPSAWQPLVLALALLGGGLGPGAGGADTGSTPAPPGGLSALSAEPASVELPAVDRAAPTRLLRADASGVEFLFEPGEPERRADADALGDAVRLDYDRLRTNGASWVTAPGQPKTIAWSERVWVPAGVTWRLRYELEDGERLNGVRLARQGPEQIRRSSRTPLETPPPAEWAPLDDQDWPESPVVAVEEELRGARVVIVTLAPYQYNGRTGEVRTFSRIRVQIDFSGDTSGAAVGVEPAPAGTPRLGRETAPDPVLARLVLNPPPPAPPGRLTPGRLTPAGTPAVQPGVPAEYFETTPEWVKVSVKRNGIYRVTGRNLQDAGVNLATVDPATLRVFAGSGRPLDDFVSGLAAPDWGEPGGFSEIGSRVEEGGDGQFGVNDALYFYGLGVDNFLSTFGAPTDGGDNWVENPHTDTAVYWVTWGAGFAASPARWVEQTAAPEDGSPETTTVETVRHYEVNDPSLFDPLPWERRIRWEKWWWQRIDDSGPGNFWDLSLPDPDTSRPASMFIRWWGSNYPTPGVGNPNGGTHNLVVTINGGSATNASWVGITRKDMTIPFTPAPTTRVIGQVTRLEGLNRVDQVLLGWFEARYTRRLNIPATGDEKGQLWFAGPEADGGATQYRVAGVGSTDPLLFDVTDPRRVIRLMDARSREEPGGRSIAFRVADSTRRRFLVASPESFLAPAAVTRDLRPTRWLRDTANAADFILIAADEFLPAAEILGSWRRQHLSGITDGPAARGANVAVVRVSDVFDEFSGGMVDPVGIRNFLQYAAVHWTGNGSGAPPPLYLCLLGDANRDTRDYEQTGVRNLLPTWQDGLDIASSSDGNPQFSSDDFYGRLGGPADRLSDLVIGRIPAVTQEMALQIIQEKIIASEQPTVPNALRARGILTADDNCQAGHADPVGNFTHMRQSESVDANIPPESDRAKLNLYDYGTECDILFKPAAKRDLLSSMNEGSWLINFIGHGSDQQIYDEKILEVPDVATLDNLEALPLLIGASCSVGKFDRANSEGLAEALVKAANGGCLATIAATHLSFSGDNSDLNVRLMQKLFPEGDNRTVPMGMALWLAKLTANPSSCATEIQPGCDRQQKYSLLGDPASPPIVPARRVRFTARPDSLIRGRTVTVSGEVLTAAGQAIDTGFNGLVDLRVEDHPEVRQGSTTFSYAMPGARLFEGRASVTGGRFTASFVVPVSLRGGAGGRLRAYVASNGAVIIEGVGAIAPLPIGGIAAGTPDTEAPSIALTVPGGRFEPGATVVVAIADTSGINLTELFEFRSILMTVVDQAGRERFRTNLTSDFAYDSGSYSRGRVETRIPTLAPGRYTILISATDNFNNRGEGSIEFQIGGAGGELAISSLFNYPNPFAEATRIYFSLSEAGTARVGLYTVSGRKLRQWDVPGGAGQNDVEWDGRDAEGDPVANGVYLVRVQLKGVSGRTVDAIERIVRLR